MTDNKQIEELVKKTIENLRGSKYADIDDMSLELAQRVSKQVSPAATAAKAAVQQALQVKMQ